MKLAFFSLALLIIAIILRVYPNLDSMLFTYDQARDSFAALAILAGNLKLTGPPTDIPTLFHGPLYYYFLAFFNLIGHGDPRYSLFGIILTNSLAVIPLAILVQQMFGKKWLTLVSSFLFLCSFESISYARWMSNPALTYAVMPIYLLGLWRRNWLLIAIGLGLAIQSQLFMLYLIPVTLIYMRRRPSIISLIVFCLLLSSFALAEIKFNFQGIQGLLNFFGHHNSSGFDLVTRGQHYGESLFGLFRYNLIPDNIIIALVTSLIILTLNTYGLKTKLKAPILFCFFIFLGHFFVFLLSNTMHIFIGVGIGFMVIILTTSAIYFLSLKSKLLAAGLFLLIIFGNLYAMFHHPESLFKVQNGMILKDEMALVNKTYEIAENNQFSLNSIDNPYQYPTLWAYLYRKNPPFYRGITAYTYPGQNIFQMSDKIMAKEFLIVEPEVGAAESWANQLIDAEKRRHDLKQEFRFGSLSLLVF